MIFIRKILPGLNLGLSSDAVRRYEDLMKQSAIDLLTNKPNAPPINAIVYNSPDSYQYTHAGRRSAGVATAEQAPTVYLTKFLYNAFPKDKAKIYLTAIRLHEVYELLFPRDGLTEEQRQAIHRQAMVIHRAYLKSKGLSRRELEAFLVNEIRKVRLYEDIKDKGEKSGEYAAIVLKGGEFGGLEYSVREKILASLRLHYDIETGARQIPAKDDVLRRWGKTGIRKLLHSLIHIAAIDENMIKETRIELARDIKAGRAKLLAGSGKEFDVWLKGMLEKYNDENVYSDISRLRGLAYLWYYLQKDTQYLYLKRRVPRIEILKYLGLSKEAANRIFGEGQDFEKVSEQVFVNKLLVGGANTERAPPRTLRGIIGAAMSGEGALKKTREEGYEWNANKTTVFSSANGVHSAGTDPEILTDCGLMPESDVKLFTQFISGHVQARAPPAPAVTISAKSAPLLNKNNTPAYNLNSAYEPGYVPVLTPADLLNNASDKASRLDKTIPGADLNSKVRKYLLSSRRDYLINAIREAYTAPAETYTFYHSLIAITRLLPYIVDQIDMVDLPAGKPTNIYLARDGANYWLAKRMVDEKRGYDLAAFDKNNIIFHVSREKLGAAHKIMEELIEKTGAECAVRGKFFDALMVKFSGRVDGDAEFRKKVDDIYQEMIDAGIFAQGKDAFRIVESMSGGIVTGFIKAVIVYKSKGAIGTGSVEEFLVAPKYEDMYREIRKFEIKDTFEFGAAFSSWAHVGVPFNRDELKDIVKDDVLAALFGMAPSRLLTKTDLKDHVDQAKLKEIFLERWFKQEAERWFADAGLESPTIVFDSIERKAGEPAPKFDEKKLLRSAVEAMVYQLQYPYSEMNLGHPVDFDGADLKEASQSKQLGAYLRNVLLANSVTRYLGRGSIPADTPPASADYPAAQAAAPDFIDDIYPGLTPGQKKVFDEIVSAHNEVFITTSDSKQIALLYNLAEFIHTMGEEHVKKILDMEKRRPAYAYLFERFLFEMKQLSCDKFHEVFTLWLVGGEGSTKEDFYKEPETINGEDYYQIQTIIGAMHDPREAGKKALIKENSIGKDSRRGRAFLRSAAYGKEAREAIKKAAQAAPRLKKAVTRGRSNLVDNMLDSSGFEDEWCDAVSRIEAASRIVDQPLSTKIRSPDEPADEAKKPRGFLTAKQKDVEGMNARGVRVYRGPIAGVGTLKDRATGKEKEYVEYGKDVLKGILEDIYKGIDTGSRISSADSPSVTVFGGGAGARLIAPVLRFIQNNREPIDPGFFVYALLHNADDGGSSNKIMERLKEKRYGVTPPIGDQANTLSMAFLDVDEYENLLDDGARLPKDYNKTLTEFVRERIDKAKAAGKNIRPGFEAAMMKWSGIADRKIFGKEDLLPKDGASVRNLIVLAVLIDEGVLQPGKAAGANGITDPKAYQGVLDNFAKEEFGIDWGTVGLSSSDPVTVYGEYDENVLLVKDGEKIRNVAIKVGRPDLNGAVAIRYKDARGNEETQNIAPGETKNIFGVTIGNNGGFAYIEADGGKWQIRERVSDDIKARGASTPYMTELVKLVNDAQSGLPADVKEIANDGTGRNMAHEMTKIKDPLLGSKGKGLYLISRLVKMQTNVAETANFSKFIDFGVLDGVGIKHDPVIGRSQKARGVSVSRVKNTTDMLVMGPGSVLTSILPHLLNREMVNAIIKSKAARKVFVFNASMDNESIRMGIEDIKALIEKVAGRTLGRRVQFNELFNTAVVGDNKADIMAFFPEFIDKKGVSMSMHDLEAALGQERAEEIMSVYARAMNDEITKMDMALYGSRDGSGGRFIGLKGSVTMCLSPSGVKDERVGVLMDNVSGAFRKDAANALGYRLKLRAFAINSPADPDKARELYNSLLDITSLPEKLKTASGNTISRATYQEALEALPNEEEKGRAEDFLMKWERENVPESALGEYSFFARYRSRAPQADELARIRVLNTMAAFMGRPAPLPEDNTPEAGKRRADIYIAYLRMAFEEDVRDSAIAPDSVFDINYFAAEDIINILDQAVYLFSEGSAAMESLKRALKYQFSRLEDAEKSAGMFKHLWTAWNRGYVDDGLITEWLIGVRDFSEAELDASGMSDNARIALSFKKYVRFVEKKDRASVVAQMAVALKDRNIINIIGQARSGKTTAAKAVAMKRGWAYIDEGNIHRAYAYKALAAVKKGELKSLEEDKEALLKIAENTRVAVKEGSIYVDGRIVSEDDLHTSAVDKATGVLRKADKVRGVILERARAIVSQAAKLGKVVLSGRGYTDGAGVNIYLKASLKKRATREKARLEGEGVVKELDEIMMEIEDRDRQDKVAETLDRYPGLFTEVDVTKMNEAEEADAVDSIISGKDGLAREELALQTKILTALYENNRIQNNRVKVDPGAI
ncbi:MAG: (d)CMP kinase [Candidatus Omnitrophica bacterium]|nr:(d)CMP kinase [Candidatus Omnitrophota bacterium]